MVDDDTEVGELASMRAAVESLERQLHQVTAATRGIRLALAVVVGLLLIAHADKLAPIFSAVWSLVLGRGGRSG